MGHEQSCHIESVSYNRPYANAVFMWNVSVWPSDDSEGDSGLGPDEAYEEEPLLDITCSYFVVYSIDADLNEHAVHDFVKRVGQFATFPYFRAMVAHYNWEAGAELPTLPVLK